MAEHLLSTEFSLPEFESAVEVLADVKPTIESLNLSSDISIGELNDTLSQDKDMDQSGSSGLLEQQDTLESPTTGEESFIFKCVFCDQVLSGKDDPKILECLHNACGSCVHQKVYEQNDEASTTGTRRGFECSVCGYFMDVQHLIDNQFLLELQGTEDLTNKFAEVKCSSCSDDAMASSWCVDCADFICDNCVQAHQRLKITKDHTIKSKEEGIQEGQSFTNAGPSQLICTLHPNEKLSLFCEHCDKLTCRDCQLTEHRDHKYKFTHEIASEARKMIQNMLTDISYKRVLLNSAMKVIDDRQALISDKKQSLVQEITNLVVRLTNTINVRGKQLVAKLNEVCDNKQKTLDEKKIALNHLSKITDHCIQFTQNALDNGSDNALLFSKRHVTTHLQRIKSRRADIPNPEIPVRIHLALDKVPDLIKGLNNVISSIGQIIVDGRIYPSQSPSPNAMPPQSSPSPSNVQQTSQQPVQPPPPPPPPSYQNRMLGPYAQQYGSNLRPQMGQMQMQNRPNISQLQNLQGTQNLNQNTQNLPQIGQTMGPTLGPMGGLAPMTLAQQLNSNIQNNMQRMQMHRPGFRGYHPMNPRMSNNGLNSQQQVTSSTHPQGMMHEHNNLRGLLQPNGNAVYVQTGPGQYQAVQPQYAQQFQNRFQTLQPYRQPMLPPNHSQQRLPGLPPRPAPYPQGFQSPPQRHAQQNTSKWHIPQQQGTDNAASQYPHNKSGGAGLPTLNNNFKIMLKSQNHDPKNPTAVTSTIPKTPSPNHMQTEKSLDKFCEDSVNDLMATIAKLDSNGVQVLAENRAKTGSSPHVDSSTGDAVAGTSEKSKNDAMEMSKDDPNEDWCAVCMDGGELVCCDKCPKVFHQFCHIPNLSVEESDTWQCLLCMNFADVPEPDQPLENELTNRQRKVAERVVLELYCQYEPSLPFREIIGQENTSYHEIIKTPIALDTIRHKLDWTSSARYTSLEQLVKDIRLMFKNAYTFNPIDSQIYADATTLEKFFDEQLIKWLPEYAYSRFDDEDEDIAQPPIKKYKRIITEIN